MESYRYLEHTADIKFQAYGTTLEMVFTNSAYALVHLMYQGQVKEKHEFHIHAEGRDLESVLYSYLEDFIFLLDSKNFLLSRIKNIEIDADTTCLEADVAGDDAGNYELELGIKAVTYHDMFVKEELGRWITQVVLDI
ncbi:archease [Candidatus Neomarinimicrobiota bacterium]